MQKFKKYSGFTLIELLVVIAIIGILAAVVLVSLNSARAKARDSRRVSDMHQMQVAFELFYNDCGGYPSALTPPTSAVTTMAGTPPVACPAGVDLGDYLPILPTNNTACGPIVGGASPAGSATAYGYTGTAAPASFTVWFCSEGPIGGTPITAAGVSHTATPGGLAN